NEKSVQEAFENLLIGAEISYSRETESIEYSSKTYRPDFVIKDIQLPVEIKLCNRKEREKELIAEINDDILAYQKKFKSIFFIIYDIGSIRDIDRFSSEFSDQQNIIFSVVKH
ncbi:MAG: PD-(D/E)XK nuclease domain-containing protein, partial [Candidatus Humimicrobiaceae bacterium]